MDESKPFKSFRQLEEETLEEARAWGRRRLENKLEKLVEEQGAIPPPLSGLALSRVRWRTVRLRSVSGELAVEVPCGKDPLSGRWICPLRSVLGLRPKERMTPALEDRVAYTALQTGSYEKASQVAAKWGTAVDRCTVHRTARRAGGRAEEQTAARVKKAMEDKRPERPKGKGAPFSLILMMDGWMIRERGEHWGLKPPEAEASRVEWHEIKGAVLFRVQDQTRKSSGRGMLVRKHAVTWRGDCAEFGRRVYAEALRRGLEQAGRLFVVADGGVWIWNLAGEHFHQAQGVLDFYHAVEHLGGVAQAIHDDLAAARAWGRAAGASTQARGRGWCIERFGRAAGLDSRAEQGGRPNREPRGEILSNPSRPSALRRGRSTGLSSRLGRDGIVLLANAGTIQTPRSILDRRGGIGFTRS